MLCWCISNSPSSDLTLCFLASWNWQVVVTSHWWSLWWYGRTSFYSSLSWRTPQKVQDRLKPLHWTDTFQYDSVWPRSIWCNALTLWAIGIWTILEPWSWVLKPSTCWGLTRSGLLSFRFIQCFPDCERNSFGWYYLMETACLNMLCLDDACTCFCATKRDHCGCFPGAC